MPNLGLHQLQACAADRGLRTCVIYTGFHLAQEIGADLYTAIGESVTPLLLGERLFSEAAFDLPPMGRGGQQRCSGLELSLDLGDTGRSIELTGDRLLALSHHITGWVSRFAKEIVGLGVQVIGCTTVFEQLSSSAALLRACKRLDGRVITLLGGANCAGEMADGAHALGPHVDHVFSGECERAFPEALAKLKKSEPVDAIVRGGMCHALDALPRVNFADYYRQMKDQIDPKGVRLPYETSRGCWWGQKHHCTFCAVHAMTYRQKSAERVLADLPELLAAHPNHNVHVVDDLMPHDFFRTLLPHLPQEAPDAHFYFNEKSNLSRAQVQALADGGVKVYQAGVEALSTPLLRRLRKGATARQNIALLRHTRMAGLRLVWNLLYGSPGDKASDYAHYPELVRAIHHLQPPQGWHRVHLLRFSPYVMNPSAFDVQDLRPLRAYHDLFPGDVDVGALAYFFEGRYPSVLDEAPELVLRISEAVSQWRGAWRGPQPPPSLHLSPMGDRGFLLTDTRGLTGNHRQLPMGLEQAKVVCLAAAAQGVGQKQPLYDWAVAQRYIVELDGWYVPLVVAPSDLLDTLEGQAD